jgi:hypothetical protein
MRTENASSILAIVLAVLAGAAAGCGESDGGQGYDASPSSSGKDAALAVAGADAAVQSPGADASGPPGVDAAANPADAARPPAGLDASGNPAGVDASIPPAGLDASSVGLDASSNPAGTDAALPHCDETLGITPAYYSCNTQDDCASGLACVGTNGSVGTYFCKPLCWSEADCSTWQQSFPSVTCIQNGCSGAAGSVGVCNDHPSDVLADCCTVFAFPGGVGQLTWAESGFTLTFISKDASLTAAIADDLIRCFFATIPVEASRFNTGCPHAITITVDPAYSGVAATSAAATVVSASYIDGNSQDYDIITHEMMHVVQDYTRGNTPGYWVEGLADYSRYRYGINNAAAGWSLPAYSSSQNYTDAYRVTARFLVWLENHVNASIPTDLDVALRSGSYTDGFWVTETGSTVDQLWTQYGQNPAL